MSLPKPGIDGTYRETCVICLTGTDTGLALSGEAEWVAAALNVMGMPMNEAAVLLSNETGCDPGCVPLGNITLTFRVCRACATKAGLKVSLVSGETLLAYSQGYGVDDGHHR